MEIPTDKVEEGSPPLPYDLRFCEERLWEQKLESARNSRVVVMAEIKYWKANEEKE